MKRISRETEARPRRTIAEVQRATGLVAELTPLEDLPGED